MHSNSFVRYTTIGSLVLAAATWMGCAASSDARPSGKENQIPPEGIVATSSTTPAVEVANVSDPGGTPAVVGSAPVTTGSASATTSAPGRAASSTSSSA